MDIYDTSGNPNANISQPCLTVRENKLRFRSTCITDLLQSVDTDKYIDRWDDVLYYRRNRGIITIPDAPPTLDDVSVEALQIILDGATYSSSNIDNIPVLSDTRSGLGDLRKPRQGRCYLFDGVNDYIAVSFLKTLTHPANKSFSIAVDFNQTTGGSDQYLFSSYNSVTNRFNLGFNAANVFGVTCEKDDTIFRKGASGPATGSWHTAVMTWSTGTETLKLYLDGSEITGTTATSNTGNATAAIGANGNGSSQNFNGKMSNFRFWESALADDEALAVSTLGAAHTTVPDHWFLMNEEAGTISHNCVNTSNNGTITNATLSTFHGTDTALTNNRANEVGHSGAFWFDGINDRVYREDANGIYNFGNASTDSPFSLCVELHSTDFAANKGGLISKAINTSSGTIEFAWQVNDSSVSNFSLYDGTSSHFIRTATNAALNENQTYRLCVTYDGGGNQSGLNIYVDGTLVAQTRSNGGTYVAMHDTGVELSIGHILKDSTSHRAFDGRLRDARVYSKALSADEVTHYATNGSSGTDPGTATLEGHWKFGTSGTSQADSSGNDRKALVSGAQFGIVPRDESDTANDVLGSALDYTGICPNPAQVNVPCVTFDGSNDQVDITTIATFGAVSFWGKYAVSLSAAGVIGDKSASTYVSFSDNLVRISKSGANLNFSDVSISGGIWYHIVVTFDGANYHAYVNGKKSPTINAGGSISGVIDVIGQRNNTTWFNGSLGDMRIYSDHLTTSEVTYLYTNGTSGTDPTDDNLVGHWPMQEGAGDIATDLSGNDNHGKLTNFTLGNAWANKTTVVKDICVTSGGGHVGWFDGVSDVVKLGSNIALTGDCTLHAWVRPTTLASESVFGKLNSAQSQLRLTTATILRWRSGTGTNTDITHGHTFTTGEWQMLTVVRSGGTISVYRNAVAPTTTGSDALTFHAGALGDRDGVDLFEGQMADARIYSDALTADEVTYLYTNGTSGTDPGTANLVGKWLLDGDALDTSGNGNHGTPSGTVFPFIPVYANDPFSTTPPRAAGKFGSIHSTLNLNPHTAAELNAPGGMETGYQVGLARQPIATVHTKFRRSGQSRARRFTAANTEYLTRGTNGTLETGDVDFTIAIWCYLDSVAANRRLIGKFTPTGGNREYLVQYLDASTVYRFIVSNDGSSTAQVDASTYGVPGTGAWHFLVAWHDATANTLNISVNNGSTDSVAHSTGISSVGADFRIGADGDGANAHDGRLANAGLWKRTLTTAERTALYASGLGLTYQQLSAGLKTNLVSYWNLDEPSGNAIDYHGTNNLTDTNTVTSAAGPDQTTDGDDRFITYTSALSGADKTIVEDYIA